MSFCYWVCKGSWYTLDADTLQMHELHIFVVVFTFLLVSFTAQTFVIFKVCICLAMSALCCGAQPSLPCDMWELSSLARDQTLISCTGSWVLNHWTTREVPKGFLFWFCPIYPFFPPVPVFFLAYLRKLCLIQDHIGYISFQEFRSFLTFRSVIFFWVSSVYGVG